MATERRDENTLLSTQVPTLGMAEGFIVRAAGVRD
jgi:hypothetical protein